MLWVIGGIAYLVIGLILMGIQFYLIGLENISEDEADAICSIIAFWPIYLVIALGCFIAEKIFNKT